MKPQVHKSTSPQVHKSTSPQVHKRKIFSSLPPLCLVVFMMSFAEIIAQNPNPASTNTQIEYLIAPNDNAYIMVTNSVTGVSHNFIINNQTNTISISLHYFTTGTYVVNLVIDGNIIDAKHLVIQ